MSDISYVLAIDPLTPPHPAVCTLCASPLCDCDFVRVSLCALENLKKCQRVDARYIAQTRHDMIYPPRTPSHPPPPPPPPPPTSFFPDNWQILPASDPLEKLTYSRLLFMPASRRVLARSPLRALDETTGEYPPDGNAGTSYRRKARRKTESFPCRASAICKGN